MKIQARIALFIAPLLLAAACTTPQETRQKELAGPMFWKLADKMVVGGASGAQTTYAGDELAAILQNMAYDTSTGYRIVSGTKTGYLLIDNIRYPFTTSTEKSTGLRILSINRGAELVRLIETPPKK